jgi:hypothetical protein
VCFTARDWGKRLKVGAFAGATPSDAFAAVRPLAARDSPSDWRGGSTRLGTLLVASPTISTRRFRAGLSGRGAGAESTCRFDRRAAKSPLFRLVSV